MRNNIQYFFSHTTLFFIKGITHVINATRDISNFFEGQTLGGKKIKYINVNINDADGVDIMRFFGTTNRFLLGCVRKGGRALIHCRAGVARSTTILCAFLMYFETWRLQPTMIYLRQVREEEKKKWFEAHCLLVLILCSMNVTF